MFDVSWEDDTKESVGERRNRKDREAGRDSHSIAGSSSRSAKSNEPAKPQLSRLLTSFTKTKDKMKDKTRDKTKDKTKGAKDGSKKKLTPQKTSLTQLENIQIKEKRATSKSDTDSFRTVTQTGSSPSRYQQYGAQDSVTNSPQSQRSNANRSAITSWSSILQPGSPPPRKPSRPRDSYIMQTTEITVEQLEDEVEQAIRSMSVTGTSPASDDFIFDMDGELQKFPRVPRSMTQYKRTQREGSESRRSSMAGSPPSDWQAPPDWNIVPTGLNTMKFRTPSKSPSGLSSGRRDSQTPVVNHLQRHIRRMKAANPKIIVERLKEEWEDVNDEVMEEDLKFEKELWMLTALNLLVETARQSGREGKRRESSIAAEAPKGPLKVLSLFETQAAAAYLATFSNAKEVHHYAPSPLQPSSIPCLYPLHVPAPYHNISYGKSVFSHVSCFYLPSQVSTTVTPMLLREIHRILVPSGTLRLTLMDHSSSIMGPKLTTWFHDNALCNIESNFRAMRPSQVLPVWLQTNGFDVDPPNAKITRLSFHPYVDEEEDDHDLAELKFEVFKMIWHENWGSFVQGDDGHWWDDEELSAECRNWKASWECTIVDAVKLI